MLIEETLKYCLRRKRAKYVLVDQMYGCVFDRELVPWPEGCQNEVVLPDLEYDQKPCFMIGELTIFQVYRQQ